MLSFECDYNYGADKRVLQRLVETNMEPLPGYGEDKYCEMAKNKIKAECGREDAEIFLLAGGTQTNQLVIDSVLAPYESVISADSGHINSHEAGAIEYSGHKVVLLRHREGKIVSDSLRDYLDTFDSDANKDHMPCPGAVYISHPTEYGTLYSLKELTEIAEVCREHSVILYLDGARLGYALVSEGTDVTLKDIARLCDVFYIGGTKVGAICGEAVVFTHRNAPKHFFTSIKQHGALLAKGRLLGIQFDTLFTDGLYYTISRNAIRTADKLRCAFKKKGYDFFIETVTNQLFIVLDNMKMEELKKEVSFSIWEKIDVNRTVVRFATSWATEDRDVDDLIQLL